MKSIPTLLFALALSLSAFTSARAQSFVLESPLIVATSIITQGTDTITHTRGDRTLTSKRLVTTPFTNRDIISTMISRALITGSVEEWGLVVYQDETGQNGVYTRLKSSNPKLTPPVKVPADLLVLPVFGPTVTRGSEFTGPNGTFKGTTDLALSTCQVKGIATTGLATNGIRTITATIQGVTYQIDTVSSTATLVGGAEGDPSDTLVRGRLVIGSAKVSTLTSLP